MSPGTRPSSVPVSGKLTIGPVPGDEEAVSDFSRPGDAPGEMIWPAGIALDSQENVYVTDEWLNRVSVFDKGGSFLRCWGSAGSGDGEFDGPSGIAIDQQDVLLSLTAATIVYRSSPRTGSSWPSGAALAAPRASSTHRGALL